MNFAGIELFVLKWSVRPRVGAFLVVSIAQRLCLTIVNAGDPSIEKNRTLCGVILTGAGADLQGEF